MKKEYYMDDNGGCYILGTTYSFADAADMWAWAEKEGYEMQLKETPEGYDFDDEKVVW